MSGWMPKQLIGLALGCLMVVGFAAQRVPDKAEDARPLRVGAMAPAFKAKTPDNHTFRFNTIGRKKPAALIFYRGGWCPYCNTHLQELRNAIPQLKKAGYEVLFLSADRPEILHDSLKEPLPDYTLLSDASMEVARSFGLAFRVDDATIEKYRKHGINLEKSSGYPHRQLPVPAVYLIGPDGKIEFVYANPDYKVRLKADELLAAAGIE